MDELPDGTHDPEIESLEITPLPSASRVSFPRHSRRILSGAAVLAVVLVVALFASLLYASRMHDGGTPSGPMFTESMLTGISMVSAGDGWMVGNTVTFSLPATSTADAAHSGSSAYAPLTGFHAVSASVLLYHYQNGAWTRVPISVPGGTPQLSAISMDSATDGWAVGTIGTAETAPTRAAASGLAAGAPHCFVLHYTGSAWQPLTLPIQGVLASVRMVAPNDGWAVGVRVGASRPAPLILHYDGHSWAQRALPADLSGDASEAYTVRGLAALPTGDVWVLVNRLPVGSSVVVNPTTGTVLEPAGTGSAPAAPNLPGSLILHSTGGAWTVQATFPGEVLDSFDMVAPGDGWAVGTNDGPPAPNASARQGIPGPLFLHYAGGAWTPGPSKVLGDMSHQLALTMLEMSSPTTGWAVGTSQANQAGAAVSFGGSQGGQSSPPGPQETILLAHYDGTTWVPINGTPLPSGTLAEVTGASFSVPDDGWITGDLFTLPSNGPRSGVVPRTSPLLLHYANGTWSTVDLRV